MLYKTIVLTLLEDQYPKLHEQLRTSKMLLSTMNLRAHALKRYHETRIDQLTQARPDSDPIRIANQALELAIEDLRDDLPCESPPTGAQETFSLDAAIASVRNPTPGA